MILPCLVLSPLKKERGRILLLEMEGEGMLGEGAQDQGERKMERERD